MKGQIVLAGLILGLFIIIAIIIMPIPINVINFVNETYNYSLNDTALNFTFLQDVTILGNLYENMTGNFDNINIGNGFGSSGLTIDNSGNIFTDGFIGIGTNEPINKLVVSDGVVAEGNMDDGMLVSYDVGYGELIGIDIIGGDYNNIGFKTSPYYNMVITTSGNIGIGIIEPINKLEVNGTIKAINLIDLNLLGSGNAFVCTNATGGLYRSAIACV